MKKVVFCDLDDTLITTLSVNVFPRGIWDMQIKFDVLDKIKEKYNPQYILIISNQGGIEKGFIDEYDLSTKLQYISRAIAEYCQCACFSMYCSSNDKDNEFRKPNTGMLTTLLNNNHIKESKEDMIMIGDASGKEGQFSDSDKKTAENFGIEYIDVNDL